MHQIFEQLLKVPKSIYRISSIFLLLIDAIALDISHILQKIQIYSVADAYNTLVGVWPEASQFAIKYKWVAFILTIITVFLSFYKPHMIMIRHLSLSIDLASISVEIKKKYSIKTVIINQISQMEEDTDIAHAIADQDAKIKQVLETRRSSELCYYGIAHIPLIFRLGFNVGDQNNVKLLHKKRNNNSVFEEWNQEPSTLVFECNEENQLVESDELLVSIATSLEIEPDALSSLNPSGKHILHFKSHNISFDNITSYMEAETARKYIMHHIRAIYKKYSIRTIHMAIASSSAFVFFLSQAFSKQHDPELIIYHYQKSIGYPWGINMNASATEALSYNNKYKIFASVYPTVEKMLSVRKRDTALELNNVSKFSLINARTLDDAVDCFSRSEAFKRFKGERTCYIYYLDDKANPQIAKKGTYVDKTQETGK